MSARPAVLDRLRAEGWRVGLGIKLEGAAPPPPDLLAELQAQREAVLAVLIEETRQPPPPPPRDLVAETLAAFPGAELVGEAESLETVITRWLNGGATVEASAGGYTLTLEGRSLAITASGAATLPVWLQRRLVDDAEERAAIRSERPAAWADESDAPRQVDWCARCQGKRWWRPAAGELGPGWRCSVCHPPPPGCETEVVAT